MKGKSFTEVVALALECDLLIEWTGEMYIITCKTTGLKFREMTAMGELAAFVNGYYCAVKKYYKRG